MSGGGSTTSKSLNSSSTKDIWSGVSPYISDILSSSQGAYNTGQSNDTLTGQALTRNTALSTSGMYNPTFATALGLSSNGTGLTSDYNQPLGVYNNISSGNNAITTGGQYKDIYTGASLPTAAQTYLTGMASSDGSTNPWLQAQLDANASRIGNRVASQMSGSGRYGSFAHGDSLARSINESNLPLLSSAYESDQSRKISAANAIDAARQAQDATKIAATTGQTNTQAQNISNALSAANATTNTLNTGQQNQYNWASLLPTLNSLQYDAGTRLSNLGTTQDNYPWTSLSNYSGILSALSPYLSNAGTTTTTGTETGNTEKEYGTLDYLNALSNLFSGGNKSAVSGAASLLSDRTEKTDIRKLGTDEKSGLGIYAYRYKGDPKTYPKMVGPMAQEVEEKFPGSTVRVGGKLAIKSEALGILGL